MINRPSGLVDPGWEYAIAQDERKKKVKCNFCGKIVSGGIYRLKQHLARVSGEVTYCDKAPEEVCLRMKENLENGRSNKRSKKLEDIEHAYLNFHASDDEEVVEEQAAYRSKGKQLMIDNNSVINMTPLRSLGYIDPGWEHGVAQDDRKKKVKCNYCEKIVSGGINRFKQHLARIPGEVAPCKNAPEKVYLKIKENMKWHRTGRRHRRTDAKETSPLYMHSDTDNDEEAEQEEDIMHNMTNERVIIEDQRLGKDFRKSLGGMPSCHGSESLSKRPRVDSVVMKTSITQTPSSYNQVKLKMGSNRKNRKEVNSAICKFFYHAGVPLHAVNSPYFHKMLELVGEFGQGLVVPPSRLMAGRFLQEEILTIKSYLAEYRSSWAITGCSIIADSWRDTQSRTIINICVSCPHGVYFVSSVDATDIVEDTTNLFNLLDKVVEEIGEQNVVQVITENTPSYEAAGKMLEEKRSHIFWTPCATYCIDKMLEDFGKIKWVGECMEKCQRITKLIYNKIWLLNLMKREFTSGEELLRPVLSKYASGFATLQSLIEHRKDLKRMFQSQKWVLSRISKSDEGKEVEKIVLNTTFWKKVQCVGRSVNPFLQLLQKMDSDESLSMPCVYNDMYMGKLAIKSIHGNNPRKYEPARSLIDCYCKPLFHHPLSLAAYFLNPSYRYRSDFIMHPDVIRGLNECIARLEPDSMRRISASMQISDYTSAKADFGTELAICTRAELDPAAWWQQHGINCLELQRIAIRILSQTCSSFVTEHNWSTYDLVYNKGRSRLSQNKWEDFVYVHYNLRLRERQTRKRSNDSISLDSSVIECLLEDWIVEVEKQTFQEDEEFFYNDTEHDNAYGNDLIGYENGTGAQRGSTEMVTLADFGPNVGCTDDATDDDDTDADAGINFLDDGLSD